MPVTTRYSATFDRPYEEDDRPEPLGPPLQRRSRSMSLQASSPFNGRPFSGSGGGGQRSSSTDNGLEQIPTRTAAKAAVKAHSNPFQFVKVASSPLYRKTEDQLKKVKEVKKPEVLKEEEEEWQTNLDSWKSRRRKMSEDVFKRQEEIKQFEIEEQINQAPQKKTKTFSEMVESRATRGRALSLCLISSPLELQDWEPGSKTSKKMNSVDNLFSGGSEENSNANSEDETGAYQKQEQNNIQNGNGMTRSNGTTHLNGNSKTPDHNICNKLSEIDTSEEPIVLKDDQNQNGTFIDSGLESISSHRAGDIPDSGSDFSQDSSGSMDCESPRVTDISPTGVEKLLEEFNSQSEQVKQTLPVHNGVQSCTNGIVSTKEDKTVILNDVHIEKKGSVNGRAIKETINEKVSQNVDTKNSKSNKNSDTSKAQERSVESENEIYVDDFEELSGKIHTPSSVKIHSPNVKKELPALPKEDKTSETIKVKQNGVSPEIPPVSSISSDKTSETVKVIQNDVSTEVAPVSSISSSKTSDSAPIVNGELKLKGADSKPKLTNGTSKTVQKKPKNASAKSNKKPVNNSKATNGLQHDASLSTNSNNLNIIYQSHDKVTSKDSESQSAANLPKVKAAPKSSLNADVPSVEKVAEEMEKLILQQLEEEERAKERASEILTKSIASTHEASPIGSTRQLKPPSEKPPPPPPENDTKAPSLNRVSSTKRIKKEIHKRRSNFLGIENGDESSICDVSSITPPLALEDILKAEREIDRESQKQMENAAIERLSIEESELIRKEQEIIENLEIEERRKLYMGQTESTNMKQGIETSLSVEEERIQNLKVERKKMEEELFLHEEQKIRLEEERHLKEREEYIRKQEGDNTAELSTPLISTTKATKPELPTSLTSTNSNTLLLEKGDGENALSDSLSTKPDVAQAKPITPPKPLKKKEVLRKERERLRQEQESLQREREEHRQKLLMEQELLMKNSQKPHAPEAPVSRIGPSLPAKPTFNSQLTSLSALPTAKENVAHTSRSHYSAQNGIVGNMSSDAKRVPNHASNRQSKGATSRGKAIQSESWGQQKVPSVKKQNDSLTESRYNQNHWLLHEAEMRRIAELNERQCSQPQLENRTPASHVPYSQAHLMEDEACSNLKASQRLATAIPSAQGTPTSYPMSPQATEQAWNYGQPMHVNGQVMKYPAPVSGDKHHIHVSHLRKPVDPPTKPSRVVPMERPEQMLSVSGRKRCSHCSEELGRGAAMIIESLQLYYHIHCFQCCVCLAQLGNGSCGTDVRVRNNKLHCQNCYSNDEAGLKFSQV